MNDWCRMFLPSRKTMYILFKVFYMQNFVFGKWNYKPMQLPAGRVKLWEQKHSITIENLEDWAWDTLQKLR